jgi:hypothetical protein
MATGAFSLSLLRKSMSATATANKPQAMGVLKPTEEQSVLGIQPAKAAPAVVVNVGDVVCFWPPHPTKALAPAEAPNAALVVHVHPGGKVNLIVFGRAGLASPRLDVEHSTEPKTSHWTKKK